MCERGVRGTRHARLLISDCLKETARENTEVNLILQLLQRLRKISHSLVISFYSFVIVRTILYCRKKREGLNYFVSFCKERERP